MSRIFVTLNREENAFFETLTKEYQQLTGREVVSSQILHAAIQDFMDKMSWVSSLPTSETRAYSDLLKDLKTTEGRRKR